MTVLLTNHTTNTSGSEAKVLQNYFSTLFVWGTFGGATVTIEASPNGTEWFTVPDLSITEKYLGNIDVAARSGDIYMRALVTGGTAASISAELR